MYIVFVSKNIVHQYFKKTVDGSSVIVKVNPIYYNGLELTIPTGGKPELREMEYDAGIFDDLKKDGFAEVSALEFNLYESGLIE